MKEYIDKEALNKLIDREIDICNSGMIRGELEFLKAIVPIAADVVERKRGEWVVTECDSGEPDGYPPFIEFHCPFCNEPYSLESGEYNWYYGDDIPLKFCHECGADMRGEKHEAD